MLFADLEEFIEVGQHQLHQLGVEVLAFLLLDQRQYLVQRPGLLVAAIRAECIEHVGQRHHPPFQRNGIALEATGIAAAVPLFVVVAGDGGTNLEQRQIAAGEHVLPQLGVGLHDLPLLRGQLARFVQDGIRNAHLADVVQRRGALDELALLLAHAQQLAEQLGIEGDPLDVQAGLLGAGLHQFANAVDDLALVVGDDLVEPDVLQRHYDVFGEQAEQASIHLAKLASGLDVKQQMMAGVLAVEHHLVAVIDVGAIVHGLTQDDGSIGQTQRRMARQQGFQDLIPHLVGILLHIINM